MVTSLKMGLEFQANFLINFDQFFIGYGQQRPWWCSSDINCHPRNTKWYHKLKYRSCTPDDSIICRNIYNISVKILELTRCFQSVLVRQWKRRIFQNIRKSSQDPYFTQSYIEWKAYPCGFISGSLGQPRHPEKKRILILCNNHAKTSKVSFYIYIYIFAIPLSVFVIKCYVPSWLNLSSSSQFKLNGCFIFYFDGFLHHSHVVSKKSGKLRLKITLVIMKGICPP
jgi:hypothetical protein